MLSTHRNVYVNEEVVMKTRKAGIVVKTDVRAGNNTRRISH
jgi:hypothetical protein